MNSEDFLESKQKFRMTHQREVILEEIRKISTHPTADEIYETVRKRLPRISLGTVYRNLEILSTYGLIQKIGPVSSQMRFHGNTRNHYHIRCDYCGRVENAPIESVENIENAVRKINDYSTIGHRLEFFGICPKCKIEENLLDKKP